MDSDKPRARTDGLGGKAVLLAVASMDVRVETVYCSIRYWLPSKRAALSGAESS
jgi:hypothetical protein